jgi:nucleotidyltransferase substrate binding protein (TIGR01987 family)
MSGEEFSMRPLRDALATLEEALKLRPLNDILRDATIQRFEYTYELAWKSLKRVLENEFGLKDLAIKELWRDAARLGLISEVEIWFEFHRGRNLTSHVYSKKTAREVYGIAKKFPPKARKLIASLERFESVEIVKKLGPINKRTKNNR